MRWRVDARKVVKRWRGDTRQRRWRDGQVMPNRGGGEVGRWRGDTRQRRLRGSELMPASEEGKGGEVMPTRGGGEVES